jgi:hypothetical protein
VSGDGFGATGIIKIEDAFGEREARRMRDVVWNELRGRYGIERDDPATWDRHPPTGLRSSKRSRAFAPICGPAVADRLDALFGAGNWRRPQHFGNVLVTMPSGGEWRVPHRVWHTDFVPTLPTDGLTGCLPALKLWALVDDVEPGGGGTPQLAGSHLAFARYLQRSGERDQTRARNGFLRSHPWLYALTRDDGDRDRNDTFMRVGADVDGVTLRVVECTGRAGDVYLTHPWVFHSIATNASARPRLMRSVAVVRCSVDAWGNEEPFQLT